MRQVIGLALALSLLSACSAKAPATGASVQSGYGALDLGPTRTLVTGTFTLPSNLVAVGSGSLVSVGSGSLVSIGSAQFHVASLGEVPVAGAHVALKLSGGKDVGVSLTTTNAQGGYQLTGRAIPGVYRIEASASGHTYWTLSAVEASQPAQAPVNVATTLVTAELLAAHGSGDLRVLPLNDFASVVQATEQALQAHGLPANWTPEQSASTMASLEQSDSTLKAGVNQLNSDQSQLEQRLDHLGYQLQDMASQMGMPPSVVEGDMQAVLSRQPQASDQEVAQQVRQSGGSASAPAAAPSAQATAAPTAAPTSAPTAAPTESPSASSTEQPTATPTPTPTPTPSSAPTMAPTSTPTPLPTSTPTPRPTASDRPAATPTPTPTPTATAPNRGIVPSSPWWQPTPAPTPTSTPTPSNSTGSSGFGHGGWTYHPAPTPTPTPSPDHGNQGNHYGQDKQTGAFFGKGHF
ncbi:MAG TPA: carboxypeptidase-like regulatory domain-containing protein [Oscillatoriaceae cyanobacterium]